MVYVSNYTYVPLCVGEMILFMVSHTLDLTPCVYISREVAETEKT